MTPERRQWTRKELRVLRKRYSHCPTREIAAALGRTDRAVYMRAGEMGLRKTAAYLASASSGRLTAFSGAGAAFRFKLGQKPWNAGLKGWDSGGRSHATRFKPGHRPQTWVPVGTERVTADGILERKVADTGRKAQDWKPVHVLKWERHRGIVPRGRIVIFRDRNRRNFRLSNLACVTRAQLMEHNTIHRYPRELKAIMKLAGRLRREIEARV